MYGAGFKGTADDTCSPSGNDDPSFVYRIDTQALHIDRAVQVGAVPKFVAASPDSRFVLQQSPISCERNLIIERSAVSRQWSALKPRKGEARITCTNQIGSLAMVGNFGGWQLRMQ